MLIRSTDNDDDTSVVLDDDEGNLVVVNDLIQSEWNEVSYDLNVFQNTPTPTISTANNTQSSGILIIPGASDAVSFDDDADVLISPEESVVNLDGVGNFSIPSTIPTILPNISRDGFTKVSSNLSTNDYEDKQNDSIAPPDYIFGSSDCSWKSLVDTGSSAIKRNHNRIFFGSVLLASALTLGTWIYLVQERNIWRQTTLKLQETMHELKRDNEIRLQMEQEKRLDRERSARDEQVEWTSTLHEVMSRLKKEDEARAIEKEKSDILEREVRRLQHEIRHLDSETKRAKELEEMVNQLRLQAEDREFQRQRAARLEKELKKLENESTTSSGASEGKKYANGGSDTLKKQILPDNCWLQSDVKLELGQCAKKAGETASSKIRKWSETIAKAHEHVVDRMAQDFSEIKDLFQSKDGPFAKNDQQKMELEDEADKNENYLLKADSITKLWNDLGGTLSKAHARVLDQMAKDYNDIKIWHNDIISGKTAQSSERLQDENQSNEIPKRSTIPQQVPTNYPSPSIAEEVPKVSENGDGASRFFSGGVKEAIYGAASAALATIAVEVVGSWLSSTKEATEADNQF